MLTFDTKLSQVLGRKLKERIVEIKDDLTIGHPDHGFYRQMCGRVAGLREAIDIIEEAIDEIEGKTTQTNERTI